MTIEELYQLAKKEGFETSTILTESIDALVSNDLQIEHLMYHDKKCVLLFSDKDTLDTDLQLCLYFFFAKKVIFFLYTYSKM